ncbi:hypothetical protein EI94DRAFT_1707458 [Lactarius quietus]|nr:hypothetical protein EI94DRAFT_1707458 [Lactarius quietus]
MDDIASTGDATMHTAHDCGRENPYGSARDDAVEHETVNRRGVRARVLKKESGRRHVEERGVEAWLGSKQTNSIGKASICWTTVSINFVKTEVFLHKGRVTTRNDWRRASRGRSAPCDVKWDDMTVHAKGYTAVQLRARHLRLLKKEMNEATITDKDQATISIAAPDHDDNETT